MKTSLKVGFISALLVLPLTASAQDNPTPKTDEPPKATSGMMMNCPMMADMSGMQKDMGRLMSEMQALIKDVKDPR